MLDVRNVNAGYEGYQVLFDVSFTADKGEKIAVIGPNGCGKTTLLRAVAGIIPYDGDVEIDGSSGKKYKRRDFAKKVAMLSQATQIYFSYTVYDTVMMGRYPHSKKVLMSVSCNDKETVLNALETVRIADLKNRDISTLSGGQLQRVFLAKVIAQEPEIVLLDEPTNHLDLRYQVELIEFLNSWSKTAGVTVIGVLHDINLAVQMADKALLMRNGRVYDFGLSKDVLNAESLHGIYDMDISGFMIKSLKFWEGTR